MGDATEKREENARREFTGAFSSVKVRHSKRSPQRQVSCEPTASLSFSFFLSPTVFLRFFPFPLFYFILFYFILFCFILFYFVLLCFTLFYPVLLCFTLF